MCAPKKDDYSGNFQAMIARRRIVMLCLAATVGLLVSPEAASGDWAGEMFEETKHDFGTIAVGAKAEFAFKFTNKYLYDVHVSRVRSSCGCSDVRVTKDTLATYESSEIVASINSGRLRGRQGSTLTVVFDKPRYAEVQLKVTVYIRGDILLEPEGFDFGEVQPGEDASRTLTVTRYGNADWGITDVLGATNHLECELSEPTRSRDRVSYSLTARLTERTEPGDLRTQLLLVSNDSRAEKIPVMVEGVVRPPLSVAPATLFLGSIRPGQSVNKRLVVRASQPFRVQEINADCDCFEFSFSPEEAKTLHLIPVKFTAGEAPGGVRRTIRVKTDLGGGDAEVVALAAIDEQAR